MAALARDLIQKGMTYSKFAVESDENACSTNNPAMYERAEANYQKAIELYREALSLEHDQTFIPLLHARINDYIARCHVMKHWLATYHARQEQERLARKRSLVRRVLPYNPSLASRGSIPSDLLPDNPDDDPDRSLEELDIGGPQPNPAYLSSPEPANNSSTNNSSTYNTAAKNSAATTPSANNSANTSSANVSADPPPALDLPPPADKLAAQVDALLSSGKRAPSASWDDVAGLSIAKDVLREATTLPHHLPTFFTGRRQRWRSVLLYGPPACGKRVLADAAAAAYDAALFMPPMQEVLELMATAGAAGVRMLFDTVKRKPRAVLYISEFEEALGVTLTGANSIKFRQARAQLLDELMALRKAGDDGVLFIAASRVPWQLDDALLSRIDRRVYIGLPDAASRAHILEVGLRTVEHDITLQEIENIANECDGYSPSDLAMLVRDAAMEPVRVVTNATHFKKVTVKEGRKKSTKHTPCPRDATGAVQTAFKKLDENDILPPAVKCLDFDLAMTSTKPSVARDMIERYRTFTENKGQDGS
ncbi:unnamed protein product [Chondrus crispus]|uniref:AAA+ ATPase domain-containing protein n=1 Tax=Chondrus crispus TaxID=2769 RepID=R7QF46_CHOCR|nr:unnamed protein product [Chondrus crispus]CDF36025.1 unnamed protein product [Chondrus crispus]|eukprot:XP_005715844.1 unnamed protein product [Chondrus crispus]